MKLYVSVYSPDGVLIEPVGYRSREEAQAALTQWVQRFAVQGYYQTADGRRLSLDELAAHCTITQPGRMSGRGERLKARQRRLDALLGQKRQETGR